MTARISSAFLAGLLAVENYVPIAAAYGASLLAWGAVLLSERALWDMGLYEAFAPALPLWSGLSVGIGLAQLVLLMPPLRRYLFLLAIGATFLWGWIAIGFYLSMGHWSTAQAMYVPAALASAWLVLRTSVVT